MLHSRYWVYAASIGVAALSAWRLSTDPAWIAPLLLFGSLAVLGTVDLLQSRHAVRRNYPVIAHFRYMLESIGPEIRQYFIQSDHEEVPFSRQQRAIVYERAKNVLDKRPFGTQIDVYGDDYEWINHSLQPATIASADFRIAVGESRAQPYNASVFNISAMSFGSDRKSVV